MTDQPNACPFCYADWRQTEIMGEARFGAGYRLTCHECHHEWDDPLASHAQRETFRRKDKR